MSDKQTIIINSEEKAFELLINLSDKNIDPSKLKIIFDGWPFFSLNAKGEQYDQSITPAMMKSFLSLQTGIYRSYAITKYGTPNINKLSKDEKSDLEIKVKVEKGSSDYFLDLQKLAEHFLDGAINNMTGDQMVLVIISAMVLLFGKSVLKSFLDGRTAIRTLEIQAETQRNHLNTIESMSSEETKRIKLINEIIKDNSKVDYISRVAHDTDMDLLKGIESTDSGIIQGVEVTGDQAALLVRSSRKKSNQITLEGLFKVQVVDATSLAGIKIRLLSIESSETFTASVNDVELSKEDILKLQSAEWKRKAIWLSIFARESNGQLKNAVIQRVGDLEE